MKSCKTLCHAMIRIAQLSLMVSFSSISQGQDTFIYLEKVQGMEEQEMDKLDCYNWAKIQSGFDLMHAPIATLPPPLQKPRQSGLIHGAGRGATVGAISGAIGGKAGKGATTGSFIGGIRRQDQTMRGGAAARPGGGSTGSPGPAKTWHYQSRLQCLHRSPWLHSKITPGGTASAVGLVGDPPPIINNTS